MSICCREISKKRFHSCCSQFPHPSFLARQCIAHGGPVSPTEGTCWSAPLTFGFPVGCTRCRRVGVMQGSLKQSENQPEVGETTLIDRVSSSFPFVFGSPHSVTSPARSGGHCGRPLRATVRIRPHLRLPFLSTCSLPTPPSATPNYHHHLEGIPPVDALR